MALFQQLLDTWVASAAEDFDADTIDLVLRSERPALDKAWFFWLLALKELHQGDPGRNVSRLLGSANEILRTQPDHLCGVELATLGVQAMQMTGQPRAALDPAYFAYGAWSVLVRSPDAGKGFLPSLRSLLGVLLPGPDRPSFDDEHLQKAWQIDRLAPQFETIARLLIDVQGDLGAPDDVAAVASDYCDWLDDMMPESHPQFVLKPLLRANVLMHAIAAYARCEDADRMYRTISQELENLEGSADGPDVHELRMKLRFNLGSALSKLGRFPEAQTAYETALEFAAESKEPGSSLQIRLGLALARYRQGLQDGLVDELADLAEQLEAALAGASADRLPFVRENLDRLYRLWLAVAVETLDTSDPAATMLFLHQVFALKEKDGKLANVLRILREDPHTNILSEVGVLLDRMDQRLDLALFVLEQIGGDSLLAISYRAGPGDWNMRVNVALLPMADGEPFADLILQNRLAVRLLAERSIPAKSQPSASLSGACRAAWQALSEEIRRDLAGAETLLVTTDNLTQLDEIPIELLHDGQAHLGLQKNIVWSPALTDLNRSLSDNWCNAAPSGRALVVRAEDELYMADAEQADVVAALELQDFRVIARDAPDAQTVLGDLGKGMDLLHYIGHGFADEIDEFLSLGPGRVLRAESIESIDPIPAPLTFLSACLAGRGRQNRSAEQRGFAAALLGQAAPALVAAKYLIPDHLAGEFAALFYHFAEAGSIQDAMRNTRITLAEDGFHPAAWGGFALFGRPEVSLQAPHRSEPATWTAAVGRYLATHSEHDLKLAQEGVDADARLTESQRRALLDNLEALAAGKPDHFTLEKFAQPRATDGFPEASLIEIMLLGFGAIRHTPDLEPQQRSKLTAELIRMALDVQSILGDSYLLVATTVEMCRRTDDHHHEPGRTVLRNTIRRLRWLTNDILHFDETTEFLRQALEDSDRSLHDGVAVQSPAEATSEQQSYRSMHEWLELASPDAAASGEWADWLLRGIGAFGERWIANVYASIDADERANRITDNERELLCQLLRNALEADEPDPGLYAIARKTFQDRQPARSVLEMFEFFMRLNAGPAPDALEEFDTSVERARQLGRAGAEAYFLFMRAAWLAGRERFSEALETGQASIAIVRRLAPNDGGSEIRTGMAAHLMSQVAIRVGDNEYAAQLNEEFRTEIEAYSSAAL